MQTQDLDPFRGYIVSVLLVAGLHRIVALAALIYCVVLLVRTKRMSYLLLASGFLALGGYELFPGQDPETSASEAPWRLLGNAFLVPSGIFLVFLGSLFLKPRKAPD